MKLSQDVHVNKSTIPHLVSLKFGNSKMKSSVSQCVFSFLPEVSIFIAINNGAPEQILTLLQCLICCFIHYRKINPCGVWTLRDRDL